MQFQRLLYKVLTQLLWGCGGTMPEHNFRDGLSDMSARIGEEGYKI